MKPISTPPGAQRADALAQADAAASAQGSDALTEQACPLKKRQEQPVPLRVLMWHIHELGGGFFVPGARPEYCIDAYAKLIKKLEADVVVLLGVARGKTERLVRAKTKDGRSCLKIEPVQEEAGVLEVEAIADALGLGWELALVRNEAGETVYLDGETAVALVRSSSGAQVISTRLVESPGGEELGLAPVMACFELQLKNGDAVPVMAQLRGAGEAKAEPAPPRGIVAVSTSSDFAQRLSPWNRIRGGLAAEYLPFPKEATVAGMLPWEQITLSQPGLVYNFTAVNPADVRGQDQSMCWEALEAPLHPQKSEEVLGGVSDNFLLYSDDQAPLAVVEELRVVDLLAAAGEAAEDSPEQGCLSELCQKHAEERPRLLDTEDPEDDANRIAERLDFVGRLSRHWPVLLSLELPATS